MNVLIFNITSWDTYFLYPVWAKEMLWIENLQHKSGEGEGSHPEKYTQGNVSFGHL